MPEELGFFPWMEEDITRTADLSITDSEPVSRSELLQFGPVPSPEDPVRVTLTKEVLGF